MATTEVRLAQSSTRFSVRRARSRNELVREALASEPHFCGFTELSDPRNLGLAIAAVEKAGYQMVADRKWECAIAVREDVDLIESGAVLVHRGKSGHPGGYSPKHVVSARGLVAPGVDLWVGEFHAVTRGGGRPLRMEHRDLMSEAIGEQLTTNGAGDRLAVAMGDINEGDQPGAERAAARILASHGVVTVWDELGRYPDTHVADPAHPGMRVPIDWVMRRKADRRLVFTDVDVTDQEHSDHHLVLVTATVEVPDRVPVTHACPVCGLGHLPPPPVV